MEAGILNIVVEEDDIDVLQHMNNMVYIKYLEKARLAWYEQIGERFQTILDRGYGTVVRNLNISYIKEARLGDKLQIKTIPLSIGNSSFVMKQWIYNEHDEVITEAEAVIVLIDLHKRAKTPIPAELANKLKHMIESL